MHSILMVHHFYCLSHFGAGFNIHFYLFSYPALQRWGGLGSVSGNLGKMDSLSKARTNHKASMF